jgi:hypothetical protein
MEGRSVLLGHHLLPLPPGGEGEGQGEDGLRTYLLIVTRRRSSHIIGVDLKPWTCFL